MQFKTGFSSKIEIQLEGNIWLSKALEELF